MLLIWIMYFSLFCIVWVLGRLSFAAEQRSSRLLQQREEEAREAIAAERRRLARELHDIVAHAVTAMMLQTSTASMMIGHQDDTARESLQSVQHLGVQAMHELHRLLLLLRAVAPAHSPDEDLAESDEQQPGIDQISSLIEIARASGLDAYLEVQGPPAPLDRSVQLATYRVVQESLTNASKHAGGGRTSVSLRWHEQLTVEVRSAVGAPTTEDRAVVSELSTGHGLLGLGERVSLIGGTFRSGRSGSDFVVTATLPLTASASEPNLQRSLTAS
jgi:signal transduction histidine kinase